MLTVSSADVISPLSFFLSVGKGRTTLRVSLLTSRNWYTTLYALSTVAPITPLIVWRSHGLWRSDVGSAVRRLYTVAQKSHPYWYSNYVYLSVCLSVCPSVRDVSVSDENGLTYCHSFFSPYGSPIILVLWHQTSSRNSDGVTPCGALNTGGYKNFAIF